jgi:hypothetical protein
VIRAPAELDDSCDLARVHLIMRKTSLKSEERYVVRAEKAEKMSPAV